jgi:hypothetical protein
VAAARSGEEERRVETGRESVEGVQDALAQRNPSALAARLRGLLEDALRVNTLHRNDARLAVDVAALERNPLLGAQAGAGGEHGDRAEPRAELDRDGLDFLPGLEGPDLGALRLRILDPGGGVALDHLPLDRLPEHLL